MKIKVQCPCETRFEFEIEPVNERMPMAINCPGCNADATELANAVIREQISQGRAAVPPAAPAPPPSQARARISVPQGAQPPAPVAAPPPPAQVRAPAPSAASLKISRPHEPASAAAEAPAAEGAPATATADAGPALCAKHGNEPAFEKCRVCNKPICPKCMEQFGYVCSGFCRNQSVSRRIFVPKYAGQKFIADERPSTKGRNIAIAVGCVVTVSAFLFFYYIYAAREPKVVYSVNFAEKKTTDPEDVGFEPSGFFQLVAPNRLLTVKNGRVAMMDVQKQTELWTADLKSADKSAAGGMMAALGMSDPQVVVTTNDVWLAFPGQLARLDLQSGTRKEVSLPGTVSAVFPGEDSFFVVSQGADNKESLTRVTLADGTTQTEEITPPVVTTTTPKAAQGRTNQLAKATPPANSRGAGGRRGLAPANPGGRRGYIRGMVPDLPQMTGGDDLTALDAADMLDDTPAPAMATRPRSAGAKQADAAMVGRLLRSAMRSPYIAAGPNAVEFESKMLEENMVRRQAMKNLKAGPSILDNKNVNASQGLDLAQEMMSNSQREMTGGMEIEDLSRYEFTLHRHFVKDVPDYTGEIIGPPRFAALKTVDLVVGGTNVVVFDKNNKKLWDAKLAYPVGNSFFEKSFPCLETKDALYLADKGTLIRYDLQTGNVRWRLPSVGITAIQEDAKGQLYVDTTMAPPESIQFSQEVSIRPGKAQDKVILKVDQANGKKLWQFNTPADEYHVMMGGKFLYSSRSYHEQDMLKLEQGPDAKYQIRLLNSKGDTIWLHLVADKHFVKAEVQQNWILLQFVEKVEVLKFFSL